MCGVLYLFSHKEIYKNESAKKLCISVSNSYAFGLYFTPSLCWEIRKGERHELRPWQPWASSGQPRGTGPSTLPLLPGLDLQSAPCSVLVYGLHNILLKSKNV